MKLKNVNIIEKYVEKVVLGLAALFAVVVLWFYVLGNPYAVQMPKLAGSTKLQPAEIEPALLAEAQALGRKISDSAPSPFKDLNLKIPPYTNEFRTRYNRAVLSTQQFTITLGPPGLYAKDFILAPPKEQKPYYVPMPPAPLALKWRTGFGVLGEPADPVMLEEFEKVIGSQKPRDFQWVSVSGEFNLNEWRSRLIAKPPADMQVIPERWWKSNLIVADTILQRQVMNPQTGQWGEIETVAPVPGNAEVQFVPKIPVNFRNPQEKWALPEAEAALKTARAERERLARAPFPSLAEGLWLPPEADPSLMTPGRAEQVQALLAEINRLQEQVRNLRRGDGASSPAGGAAPGRGPRRAPGGPAAGPGGAAGAEGAVSEAVPTDLTGMEALLRTKTAELYRFLGITGTDMTFLEEPAAKDVKIDPADIRVPTANRGDGPRTDLPDLPNLKIWQHDISVKPAQTVRYRILVSLLNPLFFQPQVPQAQRRDFYDRLILISEASDWTEEITIFPEQYFFVSNSNEANRSVTVEIYFIFGGKWHSREFVVRPGDPIGSVVEMSFADGKTNVNMNVGAIVVDVDFSAPSRDGMQGKTTTRMIFFDGKTGSLMERMLDQDRDHEKRAWLREQTRAST